MGFFFLGGWRFLLLLLKRLKAFVFFFGGWSFSLLLLKRLKVFIFTLGGWRFLWWKWNLIHANLFFIIVTIDLHFTCIHSLILFGFSTHLTLPFIKTPYSWWFHITKISILAYIAKNSGNKIKIHFIIFWYYKKFTQQYEHKIHYRSLCFYLLM
jgi:hypothetical protein